MSMNFELEQRDKMEVFQDLRMVLGKSDSEAQSIYNDIKSGKLPQLNKVVMYDAQRDKAYIQFTGAHLTEPFKYYG